MLFRQAVFSAVCALVERSAAVLVSYNAPFLADRHPLGQSPANPVLQKRADCGDGTQCFIGQCCGTGCASTCCALDQGGIGCGIVEECSFDGNVFIGCCPLWANGCTGEATRITIHTPYGSMTFGSDTATTSADGVFTTTPNPLPTQTASEEGTFSVTYIQGTASPSLSSLTSSEDPESTTSTDTETADSTITPAPSTTSVGSRTTSFEQAQTSTSIGVAPRISGSAMEKVKALPMLALGAFLL